MDGLDSTVGEALLKPHINYEPVLRKALAAGLVEGLAHITGGGLTENLDRILPEGCEAQIQLGSWPVLPLCRVMARIGKIEQAEMLRATNMGIGMVAVVRPVKRQRLPRHTRNAPLPHWPDHPWRTEGQLSRMKIRPRNRRIGILLSGRGSNFEAIAANVAAGKLRAEIAVVISNVESAPGLARARERGLNGRFTSRRKASRAKRSTQELVEALNANDVGLVVLAGFMRIFSPVMLKAYPEPHPQHSPFPAAFVSRP